MTGPGADALAVVGAGYVGLVTAVGLARAGHEVHVVEVDPAKVAALRRGHVPFYEPGLTEALREYAERIHVASGYGAAAAACRLFFVAVGTPSAADGGRADLSAVHAVVDAIPLAAGQAIVMKSTVPPGTGAECRRRLDARGLGDVPYVACPEFLRESTGLADFADPDRVVIGDDATWAGDAVEQLYLQITTADRIVRMDVTSAETMKLASNAFLATKISFINEIANLCDRTGADVEAVARAMGMDPRVGPAFLRAGIGFGGSCFGKDVAALAHDAERLGCRSEVLTAVLRTNERQWERVLDKLGDHLGELQGRVVALLGLAFKPETSNLRDASSIPLLAGLVAAGADVRAFDPKVTRELLRRDDQLPGEVVRAVRLTTTALACVAGADAVVLVTEWPEFVGLDWAAVRDAMRGTLVVDGRNALNPAAVSAAGLVYEGIGRRSAAPARARTARPATPPP